MGSFETYLEHADELVQRVINAWGSNVDAGNGAHLSDDFKGMFGKACRYRDAKRIADNRRRFNMLTESDANEEESTRREFVVSYKDWREKQDS